MRQSYPSKPQEIMSIFGSYGCRREREREKRIRNIQTFTFQNCRRNPFYCIPSSKTSKLSSIRLEVTFGSIKHSQQVWITGRWSTLLSLIHPAVNKSTSGARVWLYNKWNWKSSLSPSWLNKNILKTFYKTHK